MSNAPEQIDQPMAANGQGVFLASGTCPECQSVCEFELPSSDGHFDIACFQCSTIYSIDAGSAIAQIQAMQAADTSRNAMDDMLADAEAEARRSVIACLECGTEIDVSHQDITADDFVPDCPTCNANPLATPSFERPMPSPRKGRAGIIMVSIISLALVLSAGMVTLGMYFVMQGPDSSAARYIETNILQLRPASFVVESATYEASETDLGTSLLVTIKVANTGEIEGTPDAMQIVLTDSADKPLVSWPLDTAGQIITPGQSVQLYTRLYEPPADFANLRVFTR